MKPEPQAEAETQMEVKTLLRLVTDLPHSLAGLLQTSA